MGWTEVIEQHGRRGGKIHWERDHGDPVNQTGHLHAIAPSDCTLISHDTSDALGERTCQPGTGRSIAKETNWRSESRMKEQLIRQVPLFESLPPLEIQRLAESVHQWSCPPDTVLFHEGDPGDRFLMILEGEVEIVKALETAEERILAVEGAGKYLGEMSLFDKDRRRSASARTRTTVEFLEMTTEDFAQLIDRQPMLAVHILGELIERMRDSENATIRDLQEKNQQLATAYQELKTAQAQLIEKEKLEHELQVARKIQEQILPKEVPAIPGWQLSAYWQPARAVGGDFYDFVLFPDGKLGVVIGDVTGKGVPAALVMATTRSVLRAVVEHLETPSEILAKINDILCLDMPASMFVTCLFAVLDPTNGQLRFANAGHDLPYQRTSSGVVELRARGMPLGLMPGMEYMEAEAVLRPGQSLILYSDGIVEAHNPAGEMFGFPRLRQEITKLQPQAKLQCTDLIQFLLKSLAEFTGPGWAQEDDVTFVTLERHSPPAG